MLGVRVRARAERGQANKALCKLLGTALGVRAADVRIKSGQRSRAKLVEVTGLDVQQLRERLGALNQRQRT